MKSLGSILKGYELETDKQRRISREWQDYAYRLALELGDLPHKSLYMRLAKTCERGLLEEARIFVKGAINANNRGKLFMWKLQQLKKEKTHVESVHG